jgi:dTDP-glucose 4,6-dehydratase
VRHVITGGLGFTGRHLVHELVRRGEEVVVFDCAEPAGAPAQGVHLVRGDIRDPGDVARIGLAPGDVVYHLAARQFHGPVPRRGRDRWFGEINVGGTRTLLDAMERGGARELVFFSTDMVYGVPERTPVPTDHPRRPIGPYGRSKREAEDLLASRRSRGFRISVFRPRLIVGPGRLGILARLFRLIAAGSPVPLIGGGHNRYQMASVHDCVAAALRAVEAGLPPGPFHLGSEDPPTVRHLLGELIVEVGSRSRLVPLPAGIVKGALSLLDLAGLTLMHPEQFRIADRDYVLDLADTARTLGFQPEHDDRTMLIAAYREYASRRGVVIRPAEGVLRPRAMAARREP